MLRWRTSVTWTTNRCRTTEMMSSRASAWTISRIARHEKGGSSDGGAFTGSARYASGVLKRLQSVARSSVHRVTRARLRFPAGDPIEVELDEVVAYGPEIGGFRAWLGAVSASDQGRWVIRFADETVLGFQRSELKRIRLTAAGADITLGDEPRTLTVPESDVVSFGPEPEGARAWLGRLAHGKGEAWVKLRDGRVLRFACGGGPPVRCRVPSELLAVYAMA